MVRRPNIIIQLLPQSQTLLHVLEVGPIYEKTCMFSNGDIWVFRSKQLIKMSLYVDLSIFKNNMTCIYIKRPKVLPVFLSCFVLFCFLSSL